MSASDRGPRCISRLWHFRDCTHRVVPLIRESSRDCVSPLNGHRGSGVDARSGARSCYKAAETRDVGSSLAKSREFFAARTYLSRTGGCFMVMARAGDRAQIEAKTRPVGTYTRAPLGVRKTWFMVRRGTVVHTRILASPTPRDVLIWT